MGLEFGVTEESNNLRDAKLVGLFLDYLSEKNALTEEETIEAARFDRVIAGLPVSENAWDEDELWISSNRMIFPDEPNHLVPKPNCPGACCATLGANCATWSVMVAFI